MPGQELPLKGSTFFPQSRGRQEAAEQRREQKSQQSRLFWLAESELG